MSLNNFTPVLPVGSLILVTGVNGYIGSHVAHEALKLGYRVRGVVRSASKIAGLKKIWDEQSPGLFEVTVMSDLEKEGAFDEAMKGVDAVAHVAAISGDFTTDVAAATATVTNIELRALEAAAKTPSVKRFVLTSSIVAAVGGVSAEPVEVGQETWNEASKELAKEEGMMQAMMVYQASKTYGEQAAWAWVREHKPSFAFHTVNPFFTLGRILDPASQGRPSSAAWLLDLYDSNPNPLIEAMKTLNYVSVVDIALLHLGALLLPLSTLPPQRLFGCAGSANLNQFLAIFRALKPGKTFHEDFEGVGEDRTVYDTTGALQVLEAFGQKGWKGLEEVVRETVESVEA
ncbi:hypothetical protein JCM8547_002020 [Rhodosporidiobolus lusitaniae]